MPMREDFEAWHSEKYTQPLDRYFDTYATATVRHRWEGYQAGRAALAATPPAQEPTE